MQTQRHISTQGQHQAVLAPWRLSVGPRAACSPDQADFNLVGVSSQPQWNSNVNTPLNVQFLGTPLLRDEAITQNFPPIHHTWFSVHFCRADGFLQGQERQITGARNRSAQCSGRKSQSSTSARWMQAEAKEQQHRRKSSQADRQN